jgi:hypothetical protein
MAIAAQVQGPAEVDTDSTTRLRIQPFEDGRALWRELLNRYPGATLYHSESWIELLRRAHRLSLLLVTLDAGDKPVAGCVFARAPLSRRFISLSFSDSCPPIARERGAALRLLGALVSQNPSNRSYEIRGIGNVPEWETVECFANWRLNLDRPLAAIQSGLAVNFRRNLRRASHQTISIERGSGDDFLARFYALQLENRRRLGLPPQPWRFFSLAREIFAGNFEVWLARDNGLDVASAVFMRDGDVVHYKWGARRSNYQSHANHLLFWNAIEEFSAHVRVLDLGRADIRNHGLIRFKKELGAVASPLPSSFYPRAPKLVSAEALTGTAAILARVWSRLPMFITRLAGRVVYRHLG